MVRNPLDHVDEVLDDVTERLSAFGEGLSGLFFGDAPPVERVTRPVRAAPPSPQPPPPPKKPARKKPRKKPAKLALPPPPPPPALDRSDARLDTGRRAAALCRAAMASLETHGALTTDVFELHLAVMERWLAGTGSDAELHETGMALYVLREGFAPYKGMPDAEYLTAQCRVALVWALWLLSSYLRGRHEGLIVTRCRMTLAMVLARYEEAPDAAAARAREIGQ